MDSDKSVYFTSDLNTAAFLFSQNSITFAGLAPKDKKTSYFTFTPNGKAEAFAFKFLSGKAVVNAKEYANAIRTCKDFLFDQSRRGW